MQTTKAQTAQTNRSPCYSLIGKLREIRFSRNHTVTEYEMSKPYSQKNGLKNHTNERIFQVMTRYDQVMTR